MYVLITLLIDTTMPVKQIVNPFSNHPKSAEWSEENKISPDQVSMTSKNCFLFVCSDCGHTYEKALYEITVKNRGCQYCGKRALCGVLECKMCFENSFAANKRSENWSEENELLPHQVSRGSKEQFLFVCPTCGHTFFKSPDSMSEKKDEWCSYCNGYELCDDEECEMCFERSFASHPLSEHWSELNDFLPRNICKASNTKCYIICSDCKHTYYSQLSKITCSGTGCSYCSNTKLCDDNKCNVCFEKSFASNPKSALWNYESNGCKPRDVFNGTKSKYNLTCENCHSDTNVILRDLKRVQKCSHCKFILI